VTLKVAVVGAGIVGATIAFRLAARGAEVTVFDKGRPGSGATGHSFAWINATAKTPHSYHELNRRSMGLWDRLVRDLATDVGLRWGGQLEWTATKEAATTLEAGAAQLQRWGYPCRLLTERELRLLEPGLTPRSVTAAVFHDLDGQVEPARAVEACLQRAERLGARLELGIPTIAIGASPVMVQTASASVEADVIVLAAGTGTTVLAATAGVNVPQEESPGVVVRTNALPPILKAFNSATVVYAPPLEPGRQQIHIRQCADGTVMIGEGSQESLSLDDSQAHADELLARAREYVPALAAATAIPEPVGYRPMPLDGYPVLGFCPDAPNIYIALTHSGVTLAPIIAELATMEIMDGARVQMLDEYRPERFGRTT
jgi:glycine/D-amino acid oxidase-like deaminating enzyme